MRQLQGKLRHRVDKIDMLPDYLTKDPLSALYEPSDDMDDEDNRCSAGILSDYSSVKGIRWSTLKHKCKGIDQNFDYFKFYVSGTFKFYPILTCSHHSISKITLCRNR